MTSDARIPLTQPRNAVNDGLRDITLLVPQSRNPRVHSQKQIEQIAATFGGSVS